MHRVRTFLVAATFMFASPLAFSSKEGILSWSEFTISSQGIDSSGPVKVSGTQSSAGVLRFKVEAFGRVFVAPSNAIQELRGFSANGLSLSYEAGYKEVGGRTVYLIFSRGFTSGVVSTKTVAIYENGKFDIIEGR